MMDSGLDVIGKMIEVLTHIKEGVPGTESDLHTVSMLVRDSFLKIGIMLSVAASVPEDVLLTFVRDYYQKQTVIQN
jgi:hypothetical protein